MKSWTKKGVLDHPGDVFLLIIGSIFVLVFLYVALQGSVREQQESSLHVQEVLEGQQAILGYVRTPLQSSTTTAELIVRGESDEQQREELERLTEQYLIERDSPFLKGIVITYPVGENVFVFPDASAFRPALIVMGEDSMPIISMNIPLHDGKQVIITLYRAKNVKEIFQRGFTLPGGKL